MGSLVDLVPAPGCRPLSECASVPSFWTGITGQNSWDDDGPQCFFPMNFSGFYPIHLLIFCTIIRTRRGVRMQQERDSLKHGKSQKHVSPFFSALASLVIFLWHFFGMLWHVPSGPTTLPIPGLCPAPLPRPGSLQHLFRSPSGGGAVCGAASLGNRQ